MTAKKLGKIAERTLVLEAIPLCEENAAPAVEIAKRTGLPTRKVGGIIRWNLTGVSRKKDENSSESVKPWLYWRIQP